MAVVILIYAQVNRPKQSPPITTDTHSLSRVTLIPVRGSQEGGGGIRSLSSLTWVPFAQLKMYKCWPQVSTSTLTECGPGSGDISGRALWGPAADACSLSGLGASYLWRWQIALTGVPVPAWLPVCASRSILDAGRWLVLRALLFLLNRRAKGHQSKVTPQRDGTRDSEESSRSKGQPCVLFPSSQTLTSQNKHLFWFMFIISCLNIYICSQFVLIVKLFASLLQSEYH